MTGRMAVRAAWAALLLALAGCAGTVKQDPRVQGDVSRVEGVSQVLVQMSPDAQKQQSDNAQFNREELASFLRRRLEAKNLVASTATHRVEIVVTDIRVRSAFAAVMFGVLAGDDHVTGYVRLLDTQGRPLRSFQINANYALGGIGGGQDGTRMNWLYDKFTELASVELEKVITTPKLAAVPAAPVAAAPASSPAPASIAPVVVPTLVVNEAARVEDVEAVPSLSERGREGYRDWLTHKAPRAFVIAEGGRWYGTWGTNPKEPMDPRDPTERALKRCRDAGRSQCAVYAVDNKVMVLPQALTAR